MGPLLFNTLADLFLIHNDIDIANFADDNTPLLSTKNVEKVIESLEPDSVSLFKWFENNLLKSNVSKCHFCLRFLESYWGQFKLYLDIRVLTICVALHVH